MRVRAHVRAPRLLTAGDKSKYRAKPRQNRALRSPPCHNTVSRKQLCRVCAGRCTYGKGHKGAQWCPWATSSGCLSGVEQQRSRLAAAREAPLGLVFAHTYPGASWRRGRGRVCGPACRCGLRLGVAPTPSGSPTGDKRELPRPFVRFADPDGVRATRKRRLLAVSARGLSRTGLWAKTRRGLLQSCYTRRGISRVYLSRQGEPMTSPGIRSRRWTQGGPLEQGGVR